MLLLPTTDPKVAQCRRCRAPYFFRDEDGVVLPQLKSALSRQMIEVAVTGYERYGQRMPIELAPFNREGWTRYTANSLLADTEALRDGRIIGSPVVTDFERFLWGFHDGSAPDLDTGPEIDPDGAALELFVVAGEGTDAHWIRTQPNAAGSESVEAFGPLTIDPSALPPGSSVTVLRVPK